MPVCHASAGNGESVLPLRCGGTHAKRAKAIHCGREGCHPKAALVGQDAGVGTVLELGLPNVFYRGKKEFFENGAAAFQARARRPASRTATIEFLEKKIRPRRVWPN